jgi:hypothetical protein
MEEATENKCLELVLKEAMSHRNTVDIIVRALQDCQYWNGSEHAWTQSCTTTDSPQTRILNLGESDLFYLKVQ